MDRRCHAGILKEPVCTTKGFWFPVGTFIVLVWKEEDAWGVDYDCYSKWGHLMVYHDNKSEHTTDWFFCSPSKLVKLLGGFM